MSNEPMAQLWAPWRLSYVAAEKPSSAQKGPGDRVGAAGGQPCFICRALDEEEDRLNLLVLREARALVMLNRFPYNNGHLLICPNEHKGHLAELTPDEMLEQMELVRRMTAILDELMHPDGYNVGLNLGAAAGAGLPGHLHWHVVPRWNGDTNFMPVVSDTKVIVQSLDVLYDLIHQQLSRVGDEKK